MLDLADRRGAGVETDSALGFFGLTFVATLGAVAGFVETVGVAFGGSGGGGVASVGAFDGGGIASAGIVSLCCGTDCDEGSLGAEIDSLGAGIDSLGAGIDSLGAGIDSLGGAIGCGGAGSAVGATLGEGTTGGTEERGGSGAKGPGDGTASKLDDTRSL